MPEVHKQHLLCSWILYPSQAPFLESGLLSLSLFSITWLVSSSPFRTGASLGLALPVPRTRGADISSAETPDLAPWTSKGDPPCMPHSVLPTPTGLLFPLYACSGHLRLRSPRAVFKTGIHCNCSCWFPFPPLCLSPQGRDSSKSCCLLPLHPSMSIAKPGWIPQSDTGDSHAWIKSYGICCSVDPWHKKNSRNLNDQRNFRATRKSCNWNVWKQKETTSYIVLLFPNFTFWNTTLKVSLGHMLCSLLLCQTPL